MKNHPKMFALVVVTFMCVATAQGCVDTSTSDTRFTHSSGAQGTSNWTAADLDNTVSAARIGSNGDEDPITRLDPEQPADSESTTTQSASSPHRPNDVGGQTTQSTPYEESANDSTDESIDDEGLNLDPNNSEDADASERDESGSVAGAAPGEMTAGTTTADVADAPPIDDGSRCPEPVYEPTCLFDIDTRRLRESPQFTALEVARYDSVSALPELTAAQLVHGINCRGLFQVVGPMDAFEYVDDPGVSEINLREVQSERVFTWLRYYSGDTEVGFIFATGTIDIMAYISDGDFLGCQLFF